MQSRRPLGADTLTQVERRVGTDLIGEHLASD
jgi:hypothetical protein